MKFGVSIPLTVDRNRLAAAAQAAVAASFDAVWLIEARATGVGGGLAAAAFLAQSIPIRVGVMVDGGLYHPLHMAEDIAVSDLVSGGRIEVLVRGAPDEHLRLLVAALTGTHLSFEGFELRVPAHLEANQPAPDRLALNPLPAQPVVPMWVPDGSPRARELGLGVAAEWRRGVSAPLPTGRWPGMLICPSDVEASELMEAVRGSAAYFVVGANTPKDIATSGRRLIGPLRMPEFPDWINEQ